jgi:hypothetical protein
VKEESSVTVGTRVVVLSQLLPEWNGECGTIRHFFTLASGAPAAIIQLDSIALEVVFAFADLRLTD